MWRSPSDAAENRTVLLLGNPENRRAQLFAAAFSRLGCAELRIVSWLDFIRDPEALASRLTSCDWLRIESPGENFEVERALLTLGVSDPGGLDGSSLNVAKIAELQFENGRILPSRQWYIGWRIALDRVREILERFPGCRAMNSPRDIGVMFDKARCHEILAGHRVAATELLGAPESFAHLRQIMEEHGRRRIFLKPRHSSSASGVVAFEIGPASQQAFSSVEIVRENGQVKLFNSLTVRRYQSVGEIAELVDAVCRERCIAEAWFPKAGLENLIFDLRVLVIAGAAQHTVVRQSATPITNLHLGNRRGSIEKLRQRMGSENWRAALSVCERAAGAFPDSLYVAVDLLVAPGFRRFAVAEVNAFGDLLPNLEYQGMDTYAAELAALGMAPSASAPAANQVSTTGL
jgi:glutathione synthase/RimK-type ligase-like ATP-grasp enzyme